jgi:hypothetical protein
MWSKGRHYFVVNDFRLQLNIAFQKLDLRKAVFEGTQYNIPNNIHVCDTSHFLT